MDKEQQVRLNFLDEAQECFDRIESVLIGLSATVAQPEQLDLALRSAHSVKGGAGMMGFMPLSHIAHRIEDFFKILRVRYHSTQIDPKIENLLLQGVDTLREVSELHRQNVEIADAWLSERVNLIFNDLRQHLGDLQEKDENTLFSQNEKVNTILVVDDSIDVRRYLTLTLEKAGYRVEQAKDGQEAVDKLFGKLSVQAVICDLEMPRLDGYGVLEEVKAKPEFKSLPIIMLTSRSNEKHRKLAINLGASAYFSKPYNEQELLQKVRELAIHAR